MNPSGKLAETFPLRLEDTPCYLNFPGTPWEVNYGEGIYIGYRYYDKKKMEVLFPFGFGLSYTTYSYDKLQIKVIRKDSQLSMEEVGNEVFETDQILVQCVVKNTGVMAGKETVQVYIAPKNIEVDRPVRELKGFDKVEVSPGEEKMVTIPLSPREFFKTYSFITNGKYEKGTKEGTYY